MLHGVMLAAGESTRMPNKALLPIEGGLPCIVSGLNLLKRSGAEKITIIVSPDSCIPRVLRGLYDDRFAYVVQPTPEGVPHALSLLECHHSDTVMVTFCDNVFTKGECIPWGVAPTVAVRELDGGELDGYCTVHSHWVDKAYGVQFKLAGWYVLKGVHLQNASEHRTSIALLNSINAKMAFMTQEWHDIGTLESYKEYWRGNG